MTTTTHMIPRPVWRRRELRLSGALEELPTEREMIDAIRVLGEGIRAPISLYVEAETILVEAYDQRIVDVAEIRRRVARFARVAFDG